jgi:hypothetical protein
MRRDTTAEEGSALTEAAIVLPCLVLIVYWSAALTDVLILKLKAAEALRYALWESTVFKAPARIDAEVRAKFVDLRSPRDLRATHTGLLLYPLARDLGWRADVDMTSADVPLGGDSRFERTGGPWDRFTDMLAKAIATAVDPATRSMGFNSRGLALARVGLARARHGSGSKILKGGDLLGRRGGGDLGAGRALDDFRLQAPAPGKRPMQLVFDTWKAWPKPAPYTDSGAGTDVGTSPANTYPEVERQVSAQVRRVAFLGVDRVPGLRELRGLVAGVARAGISKKLAGGTLPDIFSSDRMDDLATNRGPITILPPEQARESWVPHRCQVAGANVPCPTQRVGDVTSGASARPLDGDGSLGEGIDRPRYTVPYRIRTRYWTKPGGMDRELDEAALELVKPQQALENGYVRTYRCRGHFFGGSRTAQKPNQFGSCG